MDDYIKVIIEQPSKWIESDHTQVCVSCHSTEKFIQTQTQT